GDTIVAPGESGVLLVDEPMVDVGGPSIGTGVIRLAHAWALRDFSLLGDSVHRRARIVSVRDLRDRVTRLYPLFTAGSHPGPLYRGDTLYWSLPLYVSSATSPLSEKMEVSGEAVSYFH